MKSTRQRVIMELVQHHAVANQDALQELLREQGYPVTQATISRDIRELGLVKKADSQGAYRYVLPDMPVQQTDLFAGNILSVDYAVNTVVIRCRSGTAQAVCTVLDGMPRPDVVGTIAGDDTIFVLIRTTEQAKRFTAEIIQKIR
ncbi:MAG: arginine repressor [Oscillospiraceae bacterium]|nr:arginine repressor [Oscillospiraceae bacterium]